MENRLYRAIVMMPDSGSWIKVADALSSDIVREPVGPWIPLGGGSFRIPHVAPRGTLILSALESHISLEQLLPILTEEHVLVAVTIEGATHLVKGPLKCLPDGMYLVTGTLETE